MAKCPKQSLLLDNCRNEYLLEMLDMYDRFLRRAANSLFAAMPLYIAERQYSLEIVELILTIIPSKGRPYMEHRRYRIGIYLRNGNYQYPGRHAAQHWAKDYLLGGKLSPSTNVTNKNLSFHAGIKAIGYSPK